MTARLKTLPEISLRDIEATELLPVKIPLLMLDDDLQGVAVLAG